MGSDWIKNAAGMPKGNLIFSSGNDARRAKIGDALNQLMLATLTAQQAGNLPENINNPGEGKFDLFGKARAIAALVFPKGEGSVDATTLEIERVNLQIKALRALEKSDDNFNRIRELELEKGRLIQEALTAGGQ